MNELVKLDHRKPRKKENLYVCNGRSYKVEDHSYEVIIRTRHTNAELSIMIVLDRDVLSSCRFICSLAYIFYISTSVCLPA